MNTMAAEMMEIADQVNQNDIQDAGGGRDNRGILTPVRAADLPDEPANVFSNAPAEFEERSRLLWYDTQKLYYHACTANRFSENYLKYSEELEKSVKQMGSVCLTKAALEQKGMEFPNLSELNTEELVRISSYHLRKAHAALEGIYKDNSLLGLSYLKQEFRWSALIGRLEATEVKIQKIKDGKLNADDLFKQDESFRGAQRTNDKSDQESAQRFQVNPSALPIDGSMAKRMISLEKTAQKQAQEARKEKLHKIRELEKLERKLDRTPGTFKPSMIELKKEDKRWVDEHNAEYLRKEIAKMEAAEREEQIPTEIPETREPVPGEISEAEARKILMDEAMKRGDQQAILEIPLEDSQTFYQRWVRWCESVTKRKNPVPGPSNEKRKALREKRKKNKH
ncbi:MAG: hypothetical protein II969_18145 [Anaerolineaceae bacterium]|nr:hypothetical protein [Anaerolineaceae bacterium]